jgi:hypothetical protein
VAAELFIGYLRRDTSEPFPVDAYFYGRIFQHVLAPVFPLDPTRRRIKALLMINEAEFYGPSYSGLAPNGG